VILLIPNPGNRGRDARANATNTKENTNVLHNRGGVGELDNVADYAHRHAPNDEHATLECSIRPPSDAQRNKEAECIGRHTEQVGSGVGVTEPPDN
jgi:hypothetical protein